MLLRRSFLAAGLLAMTMVACGEGGSSLYIVKFAASNLTLTAGQSVGIDVKLSGPVSQVTYVDITNPDAISVDPSTLKYQPGEQLKRVTLQALSPTDGPVEVTFELRDFDTSRKINVRVQ